MMCLSCDHDVVFYTVTADGWVFRCKRCDIYLFVTDGGMEGLV